MNYEQAKKILKEHGQEHLLDYYGELDAPKKKMLLDDVSKINFSVIDCIGKEQEKKEIKNVAPVSAKSLEEIQANRAEYEAEGLRLLRSGKVGAVLLAGGQGTRLGYDKPKGTFNIGITRELTIFEQLIDNIKNVTDAVGAYFHLFIMTSVVNNDETVAFFKSKNYFSYPKEKIHFYIQDTEPVLGKDRKILLSEKHRVAFSPNGNGGWYSSLVNSGLNKILEKEGIEWLNIFSVDNVLQRICDPVFIGATSLTRNFCGAKVVKKTCPEERVGVLCMRDGKPDVVEYYELPEYMANGRNDSGELIYPYGVTLNYLFNVHVLNAVIAWKLPYHLAKKAVEHIENGEKVTPAVPNAYKFETLVVDMVRFMCTCLGFEVDRKKEFAPVKNKTGVDSVDTARELLRLNGVEL